VARRGACGIALTGFGLSLDECLAFARRAGDAGATTLWALEGARDAFTMLAAIARENSSARLGTGVATFARPPMMTELAAMNLAELTHGKFVLGLGTAPPIVCEAWHGLSWSRPVARMREYVACIRRMWSGTASAPVSYSGTYINVSAYARFEPAPYARVPVYLAAVRPRMLELVGETADGWLGNVLNTPAYIKEIVRPAIARGLERAGRQSGAVELCTYRLCAAHSDRGVARELARRTIAFYAAYPYFDVVLDPAGFALQRQRIQAAHSKGDMREMVDAVTDAMVDELAFAGTPDDVAQQLDGYSQLVQELVLFPPLFGVSQDESRACHEGLLAVLITHRQRRLGYAATVARQDQKSGDRP